MEKQQSFKRNKDSPGKRGDTALHLAARAGSVAHVQKIFAECDPELVGELAARQNQDGETALYVSAEKGHVEVVCEILKVCDVQSAGIKASNSFDAFHIAAKQGHLDVLKELLQAFPALAMTTNSVNATALDTAATQGHIDIVNLLLETDASLARIARNNGKTVLHSAARMGHVEVVTSLLNKDPWLGFRTDKKGQIALHIASKCQNAEVLLELLKPDVSAIHIVDSKGNKPLHVATRKGNTIMVQTLISVEGINAVNKAAETAFAIAEKLGNEELANILRVVGAWTMQRSNQQCKAAATSSAREFDLKPHRRYMELNVLERIVDGIEEPSHLDYPLLQRITENFSDKTKIGSGGCGEVYKGILRNGAVAVKKLFKSQTIEDKMFHREVTSLIRVKHQNIVRFLGYSSFTVEHAMPWNGVFVMVSIQERLLCLEYISNGSLDSHCTDELRGLEWHTRYQIIMGICKGLLYLHEEKGIIHMDLKPANILLDDAMVPKITDFGLARLDNQTSTATLRMSPGYSAPEYFSQGKMSRKSDIYSLGKIIVELVTGSKKEPDITKVLRRWRHRWIKSLKYTPLVYQQVKKCLELALRCMQHDPKDRPDILYMIDELNKIESSDRTIQTIPCLEDMLGIEPLEVNFPFALDQQMSCSIELANNTDEYIAFMITEAKLHQGDDYIAFMITKANLRQFQTQPNKGIVPPQSKCSVTVTMPAQDKALLQNHYREELTVQSTRIDESLRAMDITGDVFIEKEGKVVDEVNVTVVFGTPLLPE